VRDYIIVAESGADLPARIAERDDVYIVQMHVEMDGVNYLDNDLDLDQLVAYHKRTGHVPKTAGSNPAQYAETYAQIKQAHPDAIVLHICYSAQLSVSYQSSLIADDETQNIYHIDSKNVTMGQGIVVEKALEMIERNPDIEPEELVDYIEDIVERVRFSFIPGDIDYLRAGGRVSNAQYLGARLLRIKPLIEVLDGLMISTKKYKGSRLDIMRQAMVDFLEAHEIEKDKMYFGYVYSLDDEVKEELESLARQAGVGEVEWIKAGAVITSHAGPGGIGILGVGVPQAGVL